VARDAGASEAVAVGVQSAAEGSEGADGVCSVCSNMGRK